MLALFALPPLPTTFPGFLFFAADNDCAATAHHLCASTPQQSGRREPNHDLSQERPRCNRPSLRWVDPRDGNE